MDREGTPRKPLNAREERVLRLLAAGRTGREIATTLGVSPDVVGGYVQSLLVKFGVRARLEAASRFRPPDAPPSPPEDAV